MEKSQHNNVDPGIRREPHRLRTSVRDAPPGAGENFPYRLIEARYAADVAAAVPGHDPEAHRVGRIEAVRTAEIAASQATAMDLELLARDALREFHFGASLGIDIGGSTLLVRPAAAVLLALMLQEWTTNSIKFGALGRIGRTSTLRLEWRINSDHVELRWQERGVPIVQLADTRRNGFGIYMIEHVLPAYIGATPRLALLPGGIDCTLILPKTIVAD